MHELNKYLDLNFKLLVGVKSLKGDKVACIISHVLRNDSERARTQAAACASYEDLHNGSEVEEDSEDDDDEVSDWEEDFVLNDLNIDSSEEEPNDNEEADMTHTGQITLRSGRLASTWPSRRFSS